MRIVAGLARGRRVQAPRGSSTRPTSDRVREALFSAIESRMGSLVGVRVLDLYAGSGALGLEALSRGAASVVFVESQRAVVRTLTENIARVGLPGTATVTADAAVFARQAPLRWEIEAGHYPFDLLLCDPPYSVPAESVSAVLTDLIRTRWLADSCLLVVERDARDNRCPWPQAGGQVEAGSEAGSEARSEARSEGGVEAAPNGLVPPIIALDRRTYGDTALWYGRLGEQTT